MTRSPGSWCGLAELGPDPTIAKLTFSLPSSRRRLDQFRRDLAFGAPDECDLAAEQRGCDPVRRCGGFGQRFDLGRVLDRPEGRGHGRSGSPGGVGQCRLELQQERGPSPVADRQGRRLPGASAHETGHDLDRVLHLAPWANGEHLRDRRHTRRLKRRHDQSRLLIATGGGDNQHRQPFERHGDVPAQPRQVGTQ